LGVGFIEKRLALQVGRLDEIAVDDSEATNTRADQQIGSGSADRAATDDCCAGSEQPLLAFRADPGEKHLARVLLLERIVHVRCGPGRLSGRAC
jgi:hypothetical protein